MSLALPSPIRSRRPCTGPLASLAAWVGSDRTDAAPAADAAGRSSGAEPPGLLWASVGDPESLLWEAEAGRIVRCRYGEASPCRIDVLVDEAGLPMAWWQHQWGADCDGQALPLPYAIAHQAFYTGGERPLGAMPFACSGEQAMDALAAAARRDPLDYRLALLATAGRPRRVLERVAITGAWTGPRAGQGVALVQWGGAVVAVVARWPDPAHLDGSGPWLAAVVDAAGANGQDGTLTALAALGLPLACVERMPPRAGQMTVTAAALHTAVLAAALAATANARRAQGG